MSRSGERLAAEMERRGLSQKQLSDRARVARSTSSGLLNKGHVPQCDTLFLRRRGFPYVPDARRYYAADLGKAVAPVLRSNS